MATTSYENALHAVEALAADERHRLMEELARREEGDPWDQPLTAEEKARAKAAVAAIRELRKGNGSITPEELIAARDEGRRY